MINETQKLIEQEFLFLPMTYILISWAHLRSAILYGSRIMTIFANWFHFFHKLATQRAIMGNTPKDDLDLLRVVQAYIMILQSNDIASVLVVTLTCHIIFKANRKFVEHYS